MLLINPIFKVSGYCLDLREICYISRLQGLWGWVMFKNSHGESKDIYFSENHNDAIKEHQNLCNAWIQWNSDECKTF